MKCQFLFDPSLRLAEAVGGIGGFGILTMGSLMPIITVLSCGFATRAITRWKAAHGQMTQLEPDNPEFNNSDFTHDKNFTHDQELEEQEQEEQERRMQE